MMSSIGFFSRFPVFLVTSFLLLSGCAGVKSDLQRAEPVAGNIRLAVYPITNLSGTRAPLKETRQLLIEELQSRGVDIISDAALEKFLARHRIRYMEGLSSRESESVKEELGAAGVLIVSYELYDEGESTFPKIALTARLVSAGDRPAILWADSVSLAGDDSPGILGLGLISDPQKLLDKAVGHLSDSLTDYWLHGGKQVWVGHGRLFGSLEPKSLYVAPFPEQHKKYSVAVLPFQNRSGRKNAGGIVMLEFIRQLSAMKDFTVIDPGMVRQKMLDERIIMLDSISLADADFIFDGLDADLLVTGTVTEFHDYNVPDGMCRVAFFVSMMDKKDKKLVLAAESDNTGDEGIVAFDLGKIRTTPKLTSEMIMEIMKELSRRLNKESQKNSYEESYERITPHI
jgi:TolB-like protein